jgi:transcriptional regulator with XRE-family HTH domain
MDDQIYRVFGSRLREAREQADVTQEELARRVDLSRTSITNIEKGRQRVLLHQLLDLAGALKVAPSDLMPADGAAEAPLRDDVAKVVEALKDGPKAGE